MKDINKKNSLLIIGLLLGSANLFATTADFTLVANFKRNKDVWGTYKLINEKIHIRRGRKYWLKNPAPRIGDLILSKGSMVFMRAQNTNKDKITIQLEKIPYKKEKKSYNNRHLLNQEKLDRLFGLDLNLAIPHQDLKNGRVTYKNINCLKKRAGIFQCKINGTLKPKNQRITAK